MKFQKGLLTDTDETPSSPGVSIKLSDEQRQALRPVPEPVKPNISPTPPVEVDKNRLFETVEETKSSSRRYLVVLGVVALVVVIAGVAGSYYMDPKSGDKIVAPKGLEIALREHFLTKQKRDSTDIAYYKCEGFVWARVGVETRTDLPNPVFRIGTYAAKATQSGDVWDITATPISNPELDVPCR
ncbi:MAG: hypothetical protein QM785_16155 [Pyrinomonadaceae bacterium]